MQLRTQVEITMALVIFFFLLAAYSYDNRESKIVKYEPVESVVIEDGRTYCEKVSEMRYSWEWQEQCEKLGKEMYCDLPSEKASIAITKKKMVFDACNYRESI